MTEDVKGISHFMLCSGFHRNRSKSAESPVAAQAKWDFTLSIRSATLVTVGQSEQKKGVEKG